MAQDSPSGPYAVTTEGNVLFDRILKVRRRPPTAERARVPKDPDRTW